ncbi:MAG: MobA/MobL family protein, partial [Pseudomonadota bacterium]
MAIYSLSMRSVGRTTHAPGTAGAHMRYIARERAASEIMANHIPEDANDARAYVDAHEAGLRKNARIMDKIMIALPRELSDTERGQLVQDYMNDLTQCGRVPWYAALHQTESDAHNPHAHVVVIDKDIETGKRVLALSDNRRDRIKKGLDPSAAEWVRERWEHHANAALERAGYDARIDRRSLEKQGIEREPQIHIGPNAQHIDTFVRKPESKIVPDPTAKNPERVIDYPMIDAGRTRRERVAEIIDFNLAKQARSEHFETRVMAQFEQEQRSVERVL